MARIGTLQFLSGLVPRFPLEMAAASLATFLGTALWFDLPNRGGEPEAAPPEKVTLQAEPLPIRMFQPSEDDQTSTFMEAVALSHVAPLRPESEVDRAAAAPPPAVQVMARAPAREKPKIAPVPQPVPRRAGVRMAALPPTAGPAAAAAAPRPPASIPTTAQQSPALERHRFSLPSVQEAANSARVAVAGSLDSLGRSVDALIHWH